MPDTAFAGLELLETATLAVSRDGSIRYVNPACENLLALSQKELLKHTLSTLFIDGRALVAGLRAAVAHDVSFTEHDLSLTTLNQIVLQVICTLTPINVAGCAALIELRPIEQQLKIANE
ncbi:MAG: hypothetical protein RI925_208, partial [Pseudomonadota bacterium]